MNLKIPVSFCLALFLTSSFVAQARQTVDEPIQITTSDGFVLDGKIRPAPGIDLSGREKVIILVHGSGPQSMDVDLTSVTKDGKKNLFFVDVSAALSEAGFTVIRYNKRSYQLNRAAREDRSILETENYKYFLANPLKYFVTDAEDVVKFAEQRYPGAEIFLFGHSQGTYVSLQVANRLPQVKGVALVGFYAASLETVLFEQIVYRPLPLFEALDTNHDGVVDGPELAVDDPVALSLTTQMGVIDLDSNGKLEKVEFQAGNLSNMIARDMLAGVGKGEALYPRTSDILAAAAFKVAFFQGLWDNQTPAYNAKAVELVVKNVWRKDNFSFMYFPELGHALDARSSYNDLQFNTIDAEANKQMATHLAAWF